VVIRKEVERAGALFQQSHAPWFRSNRSLLCLVICQSQVARSLGSSPD